MLKESGRACSIMTRATERTIGDEAKPMSMCGGAPFLCERAVAGGWLHRLWVPVKTTCIFSDLHCVTEP